MQGDFCASITHTVRARQMTISYQQNFLKKNDYSVNYPQEITINPKKRTRNLLEMNRH